MTDSSAAAALAAPSVPQSEAPAPEVPAPAPAREPISRHFSALAKKEKALVREREQIKAEKARWEAERKVEADRYKDLERYREKPKSPLEALERYGFSFKDAQEWAMNDGQPSPERIAQAVDEKFEAFKKERDAERDADRQAAADTAKKAQEKAEAQYRSDIKEFIAKNAETYELTDLHGAHDLVYDTVEAYYQKTAKLDDDGRVTEPGRILSLQEAADLVEKYLEEQVEKALSTKKFKAKGQPPADLGKPQGGQSSDPKSPAQQRVTLTNEHTASTPTLISSPRVEEDRIKRALAALG